MRETEKIPSFFCHIRLKPSKTLLGNGEITVAQR